MNVHDRDACRDIHAMVGDSKSGIAPIRFMARMKRKTTPKKATYWSPMMHANLGRLIPDKLVEKLERMLKFPWFIHRETAIEHGDQDHDGKATSTSMTNHVCQGREGFSAVILKIPRMLFANPARWLLNRAVSHSSCSGMQN